jgi:NADH-quinone oxidoreductase subunit J
MSTVLFVVAAAGTLGGALAVVLARSPVHAALSLALVLVSVAMLFVELDAGFVAAMQLLIYAGAVMVLLVFVIMLLNMRPGEAAKPAYLSVSKTLGALAAFYVLYLVAGGVEAGAGGASVDGSVGAVGRLLLSEHIFAFEGVSVLLLTAIVGAVVLGIKKLA